MSYILIDIGGTKIRIAKTGDLKTVKNLEILKTPTRYNDAILILKKCKYKLKEKIDGVCCGVPGVLNKEKSKILNSPNLVLWNKKPIKKDLIKIFKTKSVFIENDADLAGLGEVVYGYNLKNTICAYITISTGVGGTRIVNGKIDNSFFGFEPGHQKLIVQKKLKELEDLISGKAIYEKFKKQPYKIKDKNFWRKIAKLLAIGLCNVTVFWSPEYIILGGSMTKKIGISLKDVQFYFEKYLTIFPKKPKLKKAKLKELSGIYGAMVYLKNIKI